MLNRGADGSGKRTLERCVVAGGGGGVQGGWGGREGRLSVSLREREQPSFITFIFPDSIT